MSELVKLAEGYGSVTTNALSRRRFRRRRALVLMLALVLVCLSFGIAARGWTIPGPAARRKAPAEVTGWPTHGQASVLRTGWQATQSSPSQLPVPIASIAKVMTAYLVLSRRPLAPGEPGPKLLLTTQDAADAVVRRDRGESVIAVHGGERLSEFQALEALLIPSANNIAIVLARWVAGSTAQFVAGMNAAARSLGMRDTLYTDPSGLDAGTVSTAHDQLQITELAMRNPVFAAVAGSATAELPVAGLVRTTDALLGQAGFIGVKTGFDDDAGGCFAFRVRRQIAGKTVVITGVVLGQRTESDPLAAAMDAAASLADRVAARAAG